MADAWLPSLEEGYYGTVRSNLDVPLSGFGTSFVSDARVRGFIVIISVIYFFNT
jgi:hypothetical protein